MKAKTLKQINEQKQRLQAPCFGHGKLTPADIARFRKISDIAHRYSVNALEYLKRNLSPVELEEYWKVTPVPSEIYTK